MKRRGHPLTMPGFMAPTRRRFVKTGPMTLGILQAWPFYWGKRDPEMERRQDARAAAWQAMCARLRAQHPVSR